MEPTELAEMIERTHQLIRQSRQRLRKATQQQAQDDQHLRALQAALDHSRQLCQSVGWHASAFDPVVWASTARERPRQTHEVGVKPPEEDMALERTGG